MEKNYPLLIKKFTSFFCVIDVTKIILGITEAIKREKKKLREFLIREFSKSTTYNFITYSTYCIVH